MLLIYNNMKNIFSILEK